MLKKRSLLIIFIVHLSKTLVKSSLINSQHRYRFHKTLLNEIHLSNITIKKLLRFHAHRLQITASHFKKYEQDYKTSIQAIYSLSGNLKMSRLRGFIRQALSSYSKDLPEYLPENYLVTYKLPTIHEAIWTIHFPKSQVALKQ